MKILIKSMHMTRIALPFENGSEPDASCESGMRSGRVPAPVPTGARPTGAMPTGNRPIKLRDLKDSNISWDDFVMIILYLGYYNNWDNINIHPNKLEKK